MEFRPIISALTHHKMGTLLVALQISVSLAIIVNSIFIIEARIEKMNRPTGMDTENLIVVDLRGVGENYNGLANIQRDLEMLRNLPDVTSATSINQMPLSGSGSSTAMRAVPDENVTPISTARYTVDEHGLETLGLNLARGRNFYPEEVNRIVPGDEPTSSEVVIVTQALADRLFPDEDALGKTMYWGNMAPATIIGIIDQMQGSWVGWEGLERNMLHAQVFGGDSAKYVVRAKPGRRDALMPLIEPALNKINSSRVVRYVRAHEQMIERSYELDRVMANILLTVILLLVGLTALVIVGLASYFVSQRTRQIGTRRALGATRFDILRYFLLENWLITTLGAVGGCILTIAVSFWLETSFDLPRLDMRYLAASVVGLWLISQFAAYWPARRATLVPPAIATRSV